jgi:hypothetical protein
MPILMILPIPMDEIGVLSGVLRIGSCFGGRSRDRPI